MKYSVAPALSLAAALASTAALPALHAATPLAFHGAISATAATSDEYNYLGDTRDSLDLNVLELTLNTAYRFPNGLRAMAQVYAYQLEGYNDIMIDFANLDWQQNERFGVRLGYIKLPSGFYNEVQDVDSIRPMAFLPMVSYPKAFRPITNNFLGLSFYGTLDASKAGSFDYTVYGGTKDNVNGNPPMFRNQASSSFMRFDHMAFNGVWGASLIWNTPIEGLRAVASYNYYDDIKVKGSMLTAAELSMYPNDYRMLPTAMGFTTWDRVMAGKLSRYAINYAGYRFGLEYTWKNLTFATEYTGINRNFDVITPLTGNTVTHSGDRADSYYGMINWQAMPKLGFGLYYGEAYPDRKDRNGNKNKYIPRYAAYTKDLGIGVCYSFTDWFQIKAENHFMEGVSEIHNMGGINGNPSNWDKSWNYFVLKSTLSF